MAVLACTPFSNGQRGSSTSQPSPSPSATNAVWVLSSVGANIRSRPDPNSDRVATLGVGTKLLILGSEHVRATTWLHVRSESGQTEGWVLNDPDLVIHREVKQRNDPQAVYSILYPADWSVDEGNPTTFTAPQGDPQAGIFRIQAADDISQLPSLPLSPGKEAPTSEPTKPVEVYGVTSFIAVYHSSDGGWEFAVEKKISNHVFLFDFQQPKRPSPDLTLFQQMLDSVTVTG
jgi:hypothetical protein